MTEILNSLLPLRQQITTIDEAILQLLFQRRELSKQVIALKMKLDLPLRDLDREHDLIAKLIQKGNALGIGPDLIRSLYEQIIADSVALQEQIKQG